MAVTVVTARAACLGVWIALLPLHARASDDKLVCVAASERGQELKLRGAWKRARAELLVCARDTCPAPVRAFCARWIEEIDADAPTIVPDARDREGRPASGVRASVDAEVVPLGASVAVDPGDHLIRFERSGSPPVERRFTAVAKAKDVPLLATFDGPAPTSAPQPRAASPGPGAAAFVLGGVAAASLVAAGTLAVAGQVTYDGCPSAGCDDATRSRLKTERVVLVAAAGAAVVSLGALAWVLLRGTTVQLQPTARGALGVVRTTF